MKKDSRQGQRFIFQDIGAKYTDREMQWNGFDHIHELEQYSKHPNQNLIGHLWETQNLRLTDSDPSEFGL